MTADWTISKSSHACSVTGKTFEVGDDYYSALQENDDSFARFDFSPEAWENTDKSRFFSFWRAKVTPENEKKKLVIDVEAFYTFFASLEEAESENKRLFRYLVALILTRKRVLRLDEIEKTPEGDYLILFDRRADKEHRVFSPEATEEQLIEVQENLNQIFECRISQDDM